MKVETEALIQMVTPARRLFPFKLVFYLFYEIKETFPEVDVETNHQALTRKINEMQRLKQLYIKRKGAKADKAAEEP